MLLGRAGARCDSTSSALTFAIAAAWTATDSAGSRRGHAGVLICLELASWSFLATSFAGVAGWRSNPLASDLAGSSTVLALTSCCI